ncbi:ASCH domain-containing protein [Cellulomonas sp. NPDC057328]|uniref:ASCH domain-containing protein n=1 Tax=Cellulomonas sp. NPDC057328 TaxID=3346101 RepID=UPI00362B16DB
MSIHPKYAAAIFEGRKTVELRRRPFPDSVRIVVVYATAPLGSILGTVEVTAVRRLSPVTAWRGYGHRAAIEIDAFNEYFAGVEQASVIELRNSVQFAVPVRLADLRADLRAPMSWRYLSVRDVELLSRITRR